MTTEFDLNESLNSESLRSDSSERETEFTGAEELPSSRFKKTVRYDEDEVDEISAIINQRLDKTKLISVPFNNNRTKTYSKTICSGNNSQFLVMTTKGLKLFEMQHWVVYTHNVIEKGTTR
jgi:hypothetical protein